MSQPTSYIDGVFETISYTAPIVSAMQRVIPLIPLRIISTKYVFDAKSIEGALDETKNNEAENILLFLSKNNTESFFVQVN